MKISIEPKVSICVPIYNAETYLTAFLESAINQTFQDLEIICVDNCSTDGSAAIVQDFVSSYPERVFLFSTGVHGPTAAYGRNVALQHARGKYVFFCDSDDIIACNAIESLYLTAEKENSDVVCGWAYIVAEDSHHNMTCTPMSRKTNKQATNDEAIVSGCEFWMRLIRKDLLDQIGPIPTEFVFDDVAYLPVIHSYAKKISFVDCPVYYYFRRDASACGTPRLDVCQTTVLAEKYALEHCKPEHLGAVQALVAQRTRNNLRIRWQFFDIFTKWCQEQMCWLPTNEKVTSNRRLYEIINTSAEFETKSKIPSSLVMAAFDHAPSGERLEELKNNAFYANCKIVILDKQNSKIEENPYVYQAFCENKMQIVSSYFVLQEIYLHGGFFVDDDIKVINYFTHLMYQGAFFCRVDKETYSDKFFGATAGSKVIADVLNTYSQQWDKEKTFPSLAERLKTILTAKYGIPLNGKAILFQPEVSVLSPDLCMVDTRFGDVAKRVVCEHDFSDHAGEPEYVTLKRSTLELLLSTPRGSAAETAKAKEWDKLTRSHVYKFVLLWKKIGDGRHGRVLKKVFYKLLQIRGRFLRNK